MTITSKALDLIRNSNRIKSGLGMTMNKSPWTVGRWIESNEDNGPLTTVAAVDFISSETGLKKSEILEELNVHPAN